MDLAFGDGSLFVLYSFCSQLDSLSQICYEAYELDLVIEGFTNKNFFKKLESTLIQESELCVHENVGRKHLLEIHGNFWFEEHNPHKWVIFSFLVLQRSKNPAGKLYTRFKCNYCVNHNQIFWSEMRSSKYLKPCLSQMICAEVQLLL